MFLSFYSIQDPNVSGTLQVVKSIPLFLKALKYMKVTDAISMENSIKMGVLSKFDYPESISEVASRSFNRFFTGYTDEDFIKRRNDI